ncbi:unnamed protein product [Vitrella brassicaformis CCMP3155]|uniref:Uncharacterized protein n=2 Tax=Vitrella brassicaformis TaxID=1169539 RepID=A0A0G4GLK5_VITBC|nr:unnamed protein product [Vitrella brassicaformis CCMP3155]|eukprot:CEM31022.1 unnamed protein product [Vitrella brassicaformis CCMP3155]
MSASSPLDHRHRSNKQFVSDYYEALNVFGAAPTQPPGALRHIVRSACHSDVTFSCCHPVNEIRGAEKVIERFYEPLFAAFGSLTREADILIGGAFDGGRKGDWVASTGYFVGQFRADYCGVPATHAPARLRYGEFCRMQEGKITAVFLILDLIDLIHQAHHSVLPPALGKDAYRVPGPQAQDGAMVEQIAPPESTDASLQLVERMIYEGLAKFDGDGDRCLKKMGMEAYWSPEMVWYGPAGIGTQRGIDGFQSGHQRPFLEGFPDRKGGNHVARFADGSYVASMGWPSIYATQRGAYLGAPPTGRRVTMRVMDWWKREGDLLTENWVLIDLPHLFLQLGVDLLANLKKTQTHLTPLPLHTHSRHVSPALTSTLTPPNRAVSSDYETEAGGDSPTLTAASQESSFSGEIYLTMNGCVAPLE